jgi:hypothetical protein
MVPMGTHISSSPATVVPIRLKAAIPMSNTAPTNDRLRIRFPLLNFFWDLIIGKMKLYINANRIFFNQ